ncbi:MAG: F0F1 ATP synthase subunit epsilon [Cyanobacteria bacterium SID2]|nr:F0F1 ATP synthase subunit epsilon [Cyanobacteria bacterium SID2]MBP0006082.1 F0F1 ATP synthase subunit epsilon [Cyanobacteria bacterium SBC]
MTLKILLPTEILLEETVSQITAEAENGVFGLLPNHIDFVAALVPGILSYNTGDREVFVAVDEGILIKEEYTVTVSTRRAVKGGNLENLSAMVEEQYRTFDDREKQARSAIVKLEAGFVRGLIERGGQYRDTQ